jgi:predicted permease
LLLALAGGAAGWLFAVWGTGLLLKLLPSRIPVPNAADQVLLPAVHMDASVLAYALLVSLLTGLLFGLVPALQSLRCNVNESLKQGGRGYLAGPRGRRVRATLVVAESALAFVLLIGAGLMISSFRRLLASDPGFVPDHLLTVQIKLANDAKDSPYREPRQQAAAFRGFLRSVEALPAIGSAGLTEIVPLSQDDMDMGPFVIKEAPLPRPGEQFAADLRTVSPGYFKTVGTPLLRGRTFADHDDAEEPRVVIVDESLVRQYFAHQDPIGKHIHMTNLTHASREIVGVVGAVRDIAYDKQPRPTIYFPYLQEPAQTMSLVVRTASPPPAVLRAIKKAIWAVDRNQPLFNVRTMDEIVQGAVSAQRIAFILLGVFASLALALAVVGIYGVTSYTIGQRTHEIGVRMALGARRHDVFALAVGHGLALMVAGVAVGTVAALALTRFLASILYGVRATDPLTYLGVAVLLTGVAALAAFFPARRATEVNPIEALRHE